jgi:hypothetical protein
MAHLAAPQLQWQEVSAPNNSTGVRDIMGAASLFDKAIQGFTDIADRRMDKNTVDALAKIRAADPTGLRTDIAAQAYQDAVANAGGNLNLDKLQTGYDVLDTRMQNNLNQFQDRNLKTQEMSNAEDARQANLGLERGKLGVQEQARLDQLAYQNASLGVQKSQQALAAQRLQAEMAEKGMVFRNGAWGFDTSTPSTAPVGSSTNALGTPTDPLSVDDMFNPGSGTSPQTPSVGSSPAPISKTPVTSNPVDPVKPTTPAVGASPVPVVKNPVATTTDNTDVANTLTAAFNTPSAEDTTAYNPVKPAEAPLAANVQAALNKAVDMQYSDDPKMQQMGRAMEQSLRASIAQSTAPVKTGYKGVDVEGMQNLAQAAKDKRAAEILANKSSDSALDRIYGSAQENPVAASLTGALALPAAVLGAGPEAITSAVAGGGAMLRNGATTAATKVFDKLEPYAQKGINAVENVIGKISSPLKGESLRTQTENAVKNLETLKAGSNATPEALAQAEAKAAELTRKLGNRDMLGTGIATAGTAYGIGSMLGGDTTPTKDPVKAALTAPTTTPTGSNLPATVNMPDSEIAAAEQAVKAADQLTPESIKAQAEAVNKDATLRNTYSQTLLKNGYVVQDPKTGKYSLDEANIVRGLAKGDVNAYIAAEQFKTRTDANYTAAAADVTNIEAKIAQLKAARPGMSAAHPMYRDLNDQLIDAKQRQALLQNTREAKSGVYAKYKEQHDINVSESTKARDNLRSLQNEQLKTNLKHAGIIEDASKTPTQIVQDAMSGTKEKPTINASDLTPIVDTVTAYNKQAYANHRPTMNLKYLGELLEHAKREDDKWLSTSDFGDVLANSDDPRIPEDLRRYFKSLKGMELSGGLVDMHDDFVNKGRTFLQGR